MFFKIIKNDFLRKKAVGITVFLFIAIAVLLAASATNIIANLIQSISDLEKSAAPSDITQMHSGVYSQDKIDEFVERQRENVKMQETMQLLNIDGRHIYYGQNNTMAETIQDISFVIQNKKFDFLLDLDNEKLDVSKGEIGVPVYFMVEYDLEIGDKIIVKKDNYQREFIISDYARDFAMNSPLTSSKRFVINPEDYYEMLKIQIAEIEYLIQFKLYEDGDAQAVKNAYREERLFSNGPLVEGELFLIFNAISDVSVAIIIIFISMLLIIIAFFCIRLTFLASIDEDLREIGVMKAIGISKKDIKKIYLNKYKLMSILAGIIGYGFSFVVVKIFSNNMRLYLSSDLSGNLKYVLSLIAPLFVYFIIVMYSKKVLKKIDKISAVESLCSDIMIGEKKQKYSLSLLKNKFFNINIYMGLRDVWKRFKLYRLLFFIFILCTFIVILPLNIYNTMNSPEFSTYMGIEKCDIRIDLQKPDTIIDDYIELREELENDSDIKKFAPFLTGCYQVKNDKGSWDYINVEVGDFSLFPLNYLEGRAPKEEGEIALSYALINELGKNTGDELLIRFLDNERAMEVCGIYQDITNGGKTAKANKHLGIDQDSILWYVVNIDLVSGVDIAQKVEYYRAKFDFAQVSDIEEHTRQTLGSITNQIKTIVIVAILTAMVIVVLITALFLKMLLSKDMSQIAIMRSIGLKSDNIKHQYMSGVLTVLMSGIVLGMIASNYIGEILFSMAMSIMGAARIEFVNVMWQTWIVCPLMLITAVLLTIFVSFKKELDGDLSVVLKS
ncbi:FtsX-like permease family protein [Herbivorax sp. ANBcel31]|uniref:ABC transporter permease n=1 Tax=Herbivorax sp. ANBcel31 TaxID=3069754 RepID=UPI0027AE04D1|nr:FtsX-like permease family protein [Herbivorax sp. ANBcel31]MDQ2085204.1 FtsX-like permease family protein [Herbivorax sp. ANBcel31]